jgi:hypothetical protein
MPLRGNYSLSPSPFKPALRLNLDQVKTHCGDFHEGELQAALDTEERNQLIASKYLEHAVDRKAIVFAAGIGHSESLAIAFQAKGIAAEYIYGDDPDRAEKLEAFSVGEIQVLSNAMILTEGFDQPDVGAIVFARPTKSRPLYAQMLGRGLRLSPDKTDCTVLDFVDNTRHSIVTAWNFFGHQRPAGHEAKDCSIPVTPIPEDTGEALKLEDVTVVDHWVDLLEPPPEVNTFAVGPQAWHQEPATWKQVAALEAHGFDAKSWTRGQASSAIGKLPASKKQSRLLLALGFNVFAHQWTTQQASSAIERAQRQGIEPDWTLVRRAEL